MSVPLHDVEATLVEALKEALKARFAIIAANALSHDVAEQQMRVALANLKQTYEIASRVAGDFFT